MKQWFTILSVAVAVWVFAAPAIAQEAANTKLGAQEFTGTVTVSKSPQSVWSMLTKVSFSAEATGFVREKGSTTFAKVGDSARVKLTEWGDTGTFAVTHVTRGKELRISFDPDNGSYICQDRWQLSPEGKGTKITLTQTYTESSPQTKADIDKQVEQTKEKMARVKALVDGQ